MDDLNKPLILDNEYSPKKNKNSDNLSNDEIQKKSFQLLGEEELPLDTEKIIQEAETTSGFKKEIAEKNEGIIIKDGDADTKKIKKIKINHDLKKDFIDAKEETLKINHFINEQKKQLKLLHEEGLEIDQEMLNFEKNKNQLQVEFIDKQKKLINKSCEIIGDDLTCTNIGLLKKAVNLNSIDGIIIKLNQCGTITETINVIKFCKKNNIKTILSARSGDTEENYLSHLAVGWKTDMIKVGSFSRSERTSKWNELIRIQEQLN